MKHKKESRVEEQRGPINAAEKTSKSMTYVEKVLERDMEWQMLKSAQTLNLHTPKQ